MVKRFTPSFNSCQMNAGTDHAKVPALLHVVYAVWLVWCLVSGVWCLGVWERVGCLSSWSFGHKTTGTVGALLHPDPNFG